MEYKIRDLAKSDVNQVYELVRELAEFEKSLSEVEIDANQLMKDGFGENPYYGAIVAEVDGKIVGLSLYYFRYSTWKGKRLYLEDFVVKEKFRGFGIGKALFEATMKKSIHTQCNGMTWAVLNWNEIGIEFYKKYKANFDPDWVLTSITKKQILEFINK